MNLKHDIKYGDWIIYLTHRHPRGNIYSYHHNDFDGAGDDRCGTAWSVEQAIEAINDYEAEHEGLPAMLKEQAL